MTKVKANFLIAKETPRKLKILANTSYSKIGMTLDRLVAEEWQRSVAAGLVSDNDIVAQPATDGK